MLTATGSHRATTPSCTSRPKCRRYTVRPPSRISPRSIGRMSVTRARSTESTALRWRRDGPAATAGRRDPGARRSPPRARGRRLPDRRRLLRHRAPHSRRDPDRRGGAHAGHARPGRRRGVADGGAGAAVLLRRARVLRAVRGPERRAHARQAGAGDPRRDGDRAPHHSDRGRGAQPGPAAGLLLPAAPGAPGPPVRLSPAPQPAPGRPRGGGRPGGGPAAQPSALARRGGARTGGARSAGRPSPPPTPVAARVERAGVGVLPPDEITAFAARYREAAADLARARTYGVDPRVIAYLERLVSAGHNALYRARGRRRTPVLRYLLRDFPSAVVLSWRQVVAAALLFVVPGAVGYVMIRERPQLAEEVMSPVMVGRAEQAAERQARGIGYAQSPEEELPVIASAIIGNNVLVAFWTFVGGLAAGTLTVWALVMNGLQLGMGFGLFVNHGAGAYLATFIAGHGVLELTAIFIAAGAGVRIAGALITPGARARRGGRGGGGRDGARR